MLGASHSSSRVDHSQRPYGSFFLQLDCQNLALASQVATFFLHTALYQRQLYRIDTQWRGPPSFSQGPQWRSQVQRGRTLATQVRHKITGYGYLIPSGSGRKEHLWLSAQLQSAFSLVRDVDDDTEFVVIGQALLGPYVGTFRRLREKALKHSVTALTPIHVWLQIVPGTTRKSFEATIIAQQRGWLGCFRTANNLNRKFGAGVWRFIPRFLLQQCLRDRLVIAHDNAKKGHRIFLRSVLKRLLRSRFIGG